jgi:hypothetical protein
VDQARIAADVVVFMVVVAVAAAIVVAFSVAVVNVAGGEFGR